MNSPFGENFGKKLVDKFFRRIDGVLWDLMSGRVGVKTADDEIATLDGEGDSAEIVMNPFSDFGVPLPAFAQSTPVGDIKQGDLIYNAKKVLGWVIGTPSSAPGKKTRTFKLLKPDGTRGEWSPAKISSLGIDMSGAMVLRSLVNMTGAGGLGGLQGMLLPMLMGGGDFGDMESMMPMLLLSQGGFGGAAAPGAAGGSNLLQTMMMMKLFSGKKNADGTKSLGGGFFDR